MTTATDTSNNTSDETARISGPSAAAVSGEAPPPAEAIGAQGKTEPTVEPIAEPLTIESPVTPVTAEAAAPEKIQAAKIKTAKLERAKSKNQSQSQKIEPASIAPPVFLPAAPSQDRTALRRPAVLAASLLLAAACGAAAGGLSVSGFATREPPVSEAKPAVDEALVITRTIAQLRADISALKASVDTANRNSNAQMAKITERFDRSDWLQSETAAKLVRESTGSITPPHPAPPAPPATTAAVPLPPPAPAPEPLSGWVVRAVSRGTALIQGRIGLIQVEQGDVVPGLGRIEAVRRQDGHWVVVTAKGVIASR